MKCNLRKHACCVAVNFMYPPLQEHVARPPLLSHCVVFSSQMLLEHISFTKERVRYLWISLSLSLSLSKKEDIWEILVLLAVHAERPTCDFYSWEVLTCSTGFFLYFCLYVLFICFRQETEEILHICYHTAFTAHWHSNENAFKYNTFVNNNFSYFAQLVWTLCVL